MRKFYTLFAFVATGLFSAGHAQCTDPVLTSATGPDAVCTGSTATLTAVTDGEQVAWFTAETDGTELGTGTSFETDELTESTSFWAEAQNFEVDAPQSGGAKVAPTSSSGSTVLPASDPWGLSFNATEAFVLNSVDVFLTSGTAGNIVIELKDEDYNVLETLTVAAPAGGSNSNPVQFTVPLDFVIQPGIHRLVAVSSPAMIRDLASGGFPFPIGNVGSVTGGTINNSPTSNTTTYYFFYNWNFSEYSACVSDRMEVVVDVNTTEPPVVDSFSFCEAGTVANLTGEGEMLQWYQESEGGEALLDEDVLETGTYYATQTVDGCESERQPFTVSIVNVEPPVTEDLEFCNTATVADLTADGETLFWYEDEMGGNPLLINDLVVTGTYYVSQTITECESERALVNVTVNLTPVPEGASLQYFEEGDTLEDLIVEGENITWYADELGTEIPSDTPLEEGATYWVTQTIGDCESEPLLIEVSSDSMSAGSNAFSNFKYYPNPVENVLYLSNSQNIDNVEIYNLQGQRIYTSEFDSSAAEIDFSSLAAGTYIAKVESAGGIKNIKITRK